MPPVPIFRVQREGDNLGRYAQPVRPDMPHTNRDIHLALLSLKPALEIVRPESADGIAQW